VLSRHLRDEKSWNLRRIGERFVVQRWQPGDDGQRIGRRHIQLGVIGAKMKSDGFRVLRFVISPLHQNRCRLIFEGKAGLKVKQAAMTGVR
jgi:hypothetical protein